MVQVFGNGREDEGQVWNVLFSDSIVFRLLFETLISGAVLLLASCLIRFKMGPRILPAGACRMCKL
jgi:hypothetical protein